MKKHVWEKYTYPTNRRCELCALVEEKDLYGKTRTYSRGGETVAVITNHQTLPPCLG